MNTSVNQPIEITALSFEARRRAGQPNAADGRLESFPRRMVWDKREYTFAEQGMRYLVRKGQELIRLFDVSDGQTTFRLRQDGLGQWTLISTKAA